MVDFAKKLQQLRENKGMPKIPVNIDNLTTEIEPLDEGITYNGVCRSCELADTEDKNGNSYLTKIRMEITEPVEFKGRSAFINYMVIPSGSERPNSDMDVQFARFIKCLKVPHDADGFDPADAVGCEGEFTIVNEEYQGRVSPRVKDWLQ